MDSRGKVALTKRNKMVAQKGLYVQFGCGLSAPPGWLNFDASPTLQVQRLPGVGRLLARPPRFPAFPENVRYGDIVRGLPLEAGSCEAVYCSHVLEHLALDDFRAALRNTLSYLRPGGTFRLVVPDLERLCAEYVASTDEGAALAFMENAHLGARQRARGFGGALRSWLGNSSHLSMWDFKSIGRELSTAGFSAIRRAEFGDSSDPRFREVEDPGRWNGCLGVACERPNVARGSLGHS